MGDAIKGISCGVTFQRWSTRCHSVGGRGASICRSTRCQCLRRWARSGWRAQRLRWTSTITPWAHSRGRRDLLCVSFRWKHSQIPSLFLLYMGIAFATSLGAALRAANYILYKLAIPGWICLTKWRKFIARLRMPIGTYRRRIYV